MHVRHSPAGRDQAVLAGRVTFAHWKRKHERKIKSDRKGIVFYDAGRIMFHFM